MKSEALSLSLSSETQCDIGLSSSLDLLGFFFCRTKILDQRIPEAS